MDSVKCTEVMTVTERPKDDNLSYRVKLLRDLENSPDAVVDEESEKPADVKADYSESLLENVSSDPYLAELRSKYRPG